MNFLDYRQIQHQLAVSGCLLLSSKFHTGLTIIQSCSLEEEDFRIYMSEYVILYRLSSRTVLCNIETIMLYQGGYITQRLNFLQLGQDICMWNKGLTRKYSTFGYYDSLLLFLLLYIPCFTRVVKQGNFPQFLSLIS